MSSGSNQSMSVSFQWIVWTLCPKYAVCDVCAKYWSVQMSTDIDLLYKLMVRKIFLSAAIDFISRHFRGVINVWTCMFDHVCEADKSLHGLFMYYALRINFACVFYLFLIVTISVLNVSRSEMHRAGLLHRLRGLLWRSGLCPIFM